MSGTDGLPCCQGLRAGNPSFPSTTHLWDPLVGPHGPSTLKGRVAECRHEGGASARRPRLGRNRTRRRGRELWSKTGSDASPTTYVSAEFSGQRSSEATDDVVQGSVHSDPQGEQGLRDTTAERMGSSVPLSHPGGTVTGTRVRSL